MDDMPPETAGRLLEGENPHTSHPEDAAAWIGIYTQLIGFKEGLFERLAEEMAKLVPVAQADARQDVALLEAQLQRYRNRLEFWYARQWELHGVGIDLGGRTITHRGQTVALTRREIDLLSVLLRHPGRSLRPAWLVLEAWHDPALSGEELRIYIAKLRRKLDAIGLADIVTRRGLGYSLVFRVGAGQRGPGPAPAGPLSGSESK